MRSRWVFAQLLCSEQGHPSGKASGSVAGMEKLPYDIEDICARIAGGAYLKDVAADYLVNPSTLYQWIDRDPDRAKAYARARQERAHALFDEIDQLAESASGCKDKVQVAALRLKIDTKKWAAARLFPSVYGDRIQADVNAVVTANQLSDDQLDAKLKALLAKVLPT